MAYYCIIFMVLWERPCPMVCVFLESTRVIGEAAVA